jgi:hypothetical protein
VDDDSPADVLVPRILAALTDQPMTRATLRQLLAVRNEGMLHERGSCNRGLVTEGRRGQRRVRRVVEELRHRRSGGVVGSPHRR